MGTTQEDIDGWIKLGKKWKASHLIVACDTFDWSDYPVYVYPQNIKALSDRCDDFTDINLAVQYYSSNCQSVMEVYDLKVEKHYYDGKFVRDDLKPSKKKDKKIGKPISKEYTEKEAFNKWFEAKRMKGNTCTTKWDSITEELVESVAWAAWQEALKNNAEEYIVKD